MTDRGEMGLELDSWHRSQEATERIVSEARHRFDGGGFEPLTRGEDADTSTDLQVAPHAVDVEEGM